MASEEELKDSSTRRYLQGYWHSCLGCIVPWQIMNRAHLFLNLTMQLSSHYA